MPKGIRKDKPSTPVRHINTKLTDTVDVVVVVQEGYYGMVSDNLINRAKVELTNGAALLAKAAGVRNLVQVALANKDISDKILSGEIDPASYDFGSNSSESPKATRTTRSFKIKVPFLTALAMMNDFETSHSDSSNYKEKRDLYEERRKKLGLNRESNLVGKAKAEALQDLKKYQFRVTTVWVQCRPGEPIRDNLYVIESGRRHYLNGFGFNQVRSFIEKFGLDMDDVRDSASSQDKPDDEETEAPAQQSSSSTQEPGSSEDEGEKETVSQPESIETTNNKSPDPPPSVEEGGSDPDSDQSG